LSEKEIRIDIRPDDVEHGEESRTFIDANAKFHLNAPLVDLSLTVYYTDDYPDELPKLSLEPLEGEVDEEEIDGLLDSARAVVSILACLRVPRIALI
jgi:RWD domain